MHLFRLIALHKVWRPAAASQKLFQLFMLDPGQDSWITDFVSIEVQYRSTAPSVIGSRNLLDCHEVAKDAVSASPSPMMQATIRSGLVERGSEGMAERVSQLATFVNRPWRRRSNVAGNPAGKRELPEQFLHSSFILGDVRINLTPGAFEITLPTSAAPP